MSRGDVADFLAALILVYTICIVGWVVLSLIFSLGVRMPYNRIVNGVMDFLRPARSHPGWPPAVHKQYWQRCSLEA